MPSGRAQHHPKNLGYRCATPQDHPKNLGCRCATPQDYPKNLGCRCALVSPYPKNLGCCCTLFSPHSKNLGGCCALFSSMLNILSCCKIFMAERSDILGKDYSCNLLFLNFFVMCLENVLLTTMNCNPFFSLSTHEIYICQLFACANSFYFSIKTFAFINNYFACCS